MQVGRVIYNMSEEDTTDFSDLKEELKTADIEQLSNIVDEVKDDDIGESNFEMKNVYSSIPPSDYIWLQGIANHFGTSKSFIVKRIIYNARVRDEFDETELI